MRGAPGGASRNASVEGVTRMSERWKFAARPAVRQERHVRRLEAERHRFFEHSLYSQGTTERA